MDKERYNKYANDLEISTNTIQLPKSIKTSRSGLRGVRDHIVFYKQAWSVAEQWAGLPKALVYWLALTPLAITSYNALIHVLGLPAKIPLEFGTAIAIGMVFILMIFGFLAWTRLGLNRRSMELGGKQNPNYFLFYDKFESILEEVRLLRDEIKVLKNENSSNNSGKKR